MVVNKCGEVTSTSNVVTLIVSMVALAKEWPHHLNITLVYKIIPIIVYYFMKVNELLVGGDVKIFQNREHGIGPVPFKFCHVMDCYTNDWWS